MDFIDKLELGAGFISAGLAVKAINKLRKEKPFAFRIYEVLGHSCQRSKIDYQVVGLPGDIVFYKGDMLLRGLFNSSPLVSVAMVNPEENSVIITYKILGAEFVPPNSACYYIANWVNRRHVQGKVWPGKPEKNNVGKLISNFRVSYYYLLDNVPDTCYESLFDNALQNIEEFHDLYTPLIQAVVGRTVTINEMGEISGNESSSTLKQMTEKIDHTEALPHEVISQNLGVAIKRFEELGYETEVYQGTQFSKIYVPPSPDTRNMSGMFHAILSNQNELVFQSYSPCVEDPQGKIQTSDYLDYVNSKSAGKFFYHHGLKRLVFRTCIPLHNIKSLPKELISNTCFEHLVANSLDLLGFQFIKDERTSPEDIVEELLKGVLPDYSQFPSNPIT